MIKLLIVDDSALMRRQLMTLFQAEGDFEIRQARNGDEAVRENREFQPDVVTLDINMPEMDGLTALSLIMAERPVAVVMVSSLTERGSVGHIRGAEPGRGGLRRQAWRNDLVCPSTGSRRNWWPKCAAPLGHGQEAKGSIAAGSCPAHAGGAQEGAAQSSAPQQQPRRPATACW